MKRISVLVSLAIMTFAAQAQNFNGKIADHNKGEMDVVLTMFGFEKLVKIGTLSADGNLFLLILNKKTIIPTPFEIMNL